MVIAPASKEISRMIIQYAHCVTRRMLGDCFDIDLPHAVWMLPFEESPSSSDQLSLCHNPESDQDPVDAHVRNVAKNGSQTLGSTTVFLVSLKYLVDLFLRQGMDGLGPGALWS